jgi:2-methylisocitrate lyase-like PEP mutase family enzyme
MSTSFSAEQTGKFEAFKALHQGPQPFVMPNPWNAGTARMLEALGFAALATTSAGLAFAMGRLDSAQGLSRDSILANAREIAEATALPVSADLEDGFGASPETCAQTIGEATAMGLVGGSIEDATGDTAQPIFDFGLAVERVGAAAEAARGKPFVLTARAENFLHGRPDIDDTIKRLQAFAKAGADVLYAPGLPDLEAIRHVCSSLDKPVNVVMGLSGPVYSVQQLAEAGVRRVSVGGSLARAALGAFMRAAQEVKTQGTFNYASTAIPGSEIARYMTAAKR